MKTTRSPCALRHEVEDRVESSYGEEDDEEEEEEDEA